MDLNFFPFDFHNRIQKLNVGGQIFTTTTQTFAMILHGLEGFVKDGDGNVFIDRDGELFGYILNFCRDKAHPSRKLFQV